MKVDVLLHYICMREEITSVVSKQFQQSLIDMCKYKFKEFL